jgi:hypothetical protein
MDWDLDWLEIGVLDLGLGTRTAAHLPGGILGIRATGRLCVYGLQGLDWIGLDWIG